MENRKEISVCFLAADAPIRSNFMIRCLAVSRELSRRGYASCCVQSDPFFRGAPNLLKHVSRWKQIIQARPDILVLHRTCNLVDYEMVMKIKKLGVSKILFDFDDALFHVRLPGRLAYSHLSKILSLSDGVTAGSHYLTDFANKFNGNVTLLPSSVDMQLFNPRLRPTNDRGTITIGWVGGGAATRLSELRMLKKPLDAIALSHKLRFKMVSALSNEIRREFANQRFDVDFGLDHWAPIEKIPAAIADFDIGVMPLTNDNWSRGKCAIKLLQCMAMKLPTIASNVGENKYVIDQGRTGFLASTTEEWSECIEKLILDADLRDALGQNGYEKVREQYSLQVTVDELEHVIEAVGADPKV